MIFKAFLDLKLTDHITVFRLFKDFLHAFVNIDSLDKQVGVSSYPYWAFFTVFFSCLSTVWKELILLFANNNTNNNKKNLKIIRQKKKTQIKTIIV